MLAFNGLLREALIICAVLSFPVLVAATLVSTLVAVAQAATQVQEQTLTMLPKMAVVAIMIFVFGGFGMGLVATLFREAATNMPSLLAN